MAVALRRPEPLELVLIGAGALAVVVIAGFVAMVIALAGLGRLTPDVEISRMPYWFWYFRAEPQVQRWFGFGLTVSSIFACAAVLKLFAGKPRSEHGEARWATGAELRRANLRARTGLLLGYRGGQPLRFGGQEHVVVYAPTRSGKGVGFVIPNLLTWPNSAIVLDVKGENHRATAGQRAAMGQTIHVFDPFAKEARTACFNPLGHIKRGNGSAAVRELRKVALILFPEDRNGGDFFWVGASRNIFVAVAMFLIESGEADKEITLGAIARELTVTDLRAHLTGIIEARSTGPKALSGLCLQLLRDSAASPDNTFQNIRQTITSRLSLWTLPEVDNATCRSDFRIEDLLARSTTVYLATGPANLLLIAPLYGLILQQVVDRATESLPEPQADPHLLVMMDEFAQLGALPVIKQAFALSAGYGVRLAAVIQTPAQLRHLYGPEGAREILANCGAELVFTPRELDDARNISERLGEYDFPAFSRSRPAGFSSGRRSVSQAEHGRRLMLSHELMTMDAGAGLVIRTGAKPTLCRKIVWFRDRSLRRLHKPAPIVKALADLNGAHKTHQTPAHAIANHKLFTPPRQERSR